MAFLVLSCSFICSLGCDLSEPHRLFKSKTRLFLRQMRRINPVSCLEDRHDFGFPQEAFDGSQFQKAQGMFVLYDIVQQTLHLFSRKDSYTAWNETLLDQFCSVLDQQLMDLEACLTQELQKEDSPLIKEDFLLAFRKYFRRITVYLQKKKHSLCTWEIVRLEIMRSFSSSTRLQARLMRKDWCLAQHGTISHELPCILSYPKTHSF